MIYIYKLCTIPEFLLCTTLLLNGCVTHSNVILLGTSRKKKGEAGEAGRKDKIGGNLIIRNHFLKFAGRNGGGY
jgi:hypothetical protein